MNFNPHHPRGWRLSAWFSNFDAASEISIHTTLAGGDKSMGLKRLRRIISIHTTLAGGDGSVSGYRERVRHFNPHHPRGWRPPHRRYRKGPPQFQSTPPSRVATCALLDNAGRRADFNPHHPRGWRLGNKGVVGNAHLISIHTTLAGGDPSGSCFPRSLHYFNPHHPRGWRPIANEVGKTPQG